MITIPDLNRCRFAVAGLLAAKSHRIFFGFTGKRYREHLSFSGPRRLESQKRIPPGRKTNELDSDYSVGRY